MQVNETTYAIVWQAVCERFENPVNVMMQTLNKLCDLPKVRHPSQFGLFADEIVSIRNQVTILGYEIDELASIIITYHLIAKLDSTTAELFQTSITNFTKSPGLNDFIKFLRGGSLQIGTKLSEQSYAITGAVIIVPPYWAQY